MNVLRQSLDSLFRLWPDAQVTLAVETKDTRFEVERFADCRIVRTEAPRSGNLNGRTFVQEELELLSSLPGERVLKFDSDVVFVTKELWEIGEGYDLTGMTDGINKGQLSYGAFHSLSKNLIHTLRDFVNAGGLSGWEPVVGAGFPEDLVIAQLAHRLGMRVLRPPFSRYATWVWDDKTPRKPTSSVVILNNLNLMRADLRRRLRREPTALELDTYRVHLMRLHA